MFVTIFVAFLISCGISAVSPDLPMLYMILLNILLLFPVDYIYSNLFEKRIKNDLEEYLLNHPPGDYVYERSPFYMAPKFTGFPSEESVECFKECVLSEMVEVAYCFKMEKLCSTGLLWMLVPLNAFQRTWTGSKSFIDIHGLKSRVDALLKYTDHPDEYQYFDRVFDRLYSLN